MQDTIREVIPAVAALGRGARRGCGLVIGEERAVALEHTLRAEEVELRLSDGRSVQCAHVGSDRHTGLALLSGDFAGIAAPVLADSLPDLAADICSLADPGSGLRVTRGAVSCAAVAVRGRAGRALEMIEHTAPIPSGAGGGPILDEQGAVLGVSALRGDPGFALAVPAAAVTAAIERISTGREPARLGVALAPPRVARRMRAAVGLPERGGLLVRAVEERSPAATAGVRAGDLLVRLGGAELETLDALFSALERNAGASAVKLGVVRGEEQSELVVDLAGGAA